MCGIFTIAGKEAVLGERELNVALGTLSKRGPDDRGVLTFPHCTLGHTRLSIIDLGGGHQPMEDSERGLAVTFNGEIYNYRELRVELARLGHRFRTDSDTEVILKAYAEWGAEAPKHLDGMFAFALWDEKQQQLFLARDRFGKKPLYYSLQNGTLAVASEVKALIAAGTLKPELDLASLDNYLILGYLPPWKSAYKNVEQVPPAHYAVFKGGELTINRYWQLEFNPITIGYEEAKEETARLLTEAVKKRMLAADVEVGALLSGGVDSTMVCLLAQQFLDHPLKTFSLGYGDYINELPFAEQAAKTIGSEHYTLQASADMVGELEEVIAYFDEPHADNSDFPQHLVSKLAASKVKVALSGDGGDELFLGYGWHTRHENLSYRAHTFEKLFLNPMQGRMRAYRTFTPLERVALWGSPFLHSDLYQRDAYTAAHDSLENITVFDFTTYLPGQLLTKVDRTGMMHGLEVRSPLLDTALAEFVVNLPREYKLGGRGQKRILKDILGEYMPAEFVDRRKQGFGAPGVKWLRSPHMSEYAREKLGPGAEVRTLLRGSMINWYLRDFYEREHNRATGRIWALLCLEIWLRTHKV